MSQSHYKQRAVPTLNRPAWIDGRRLVVIVLAAGVVWSLSRVPWDQPALNVNGLSSLGEMAAAMVQPDFSPSTLRIAVEGMWRTIVYATAGISLAIVMALPAGVVASGVLAGNSAVRAVTASAMRALLGFLRAIHELVWVWLFVAAIGLSPYAAVLAIAVPYAGILGRILADMLNDVPEPPIEGLRLTQATNSQILLYGRLPMALPSMVSYSMYRYECAVRSAAVMSFVGLGGIGYQIEISLEDLHFGQVWTFVYALIAVVILADLWSGFVRRRLVT